jgi:hypothetical protein
VGREYRLPLDPGRTAPSIEAEILMLRQQINVLRRKSGGLTKLFAWP